MVQPSLSSPLAKGSARRPRGLLGRLRAWHGLALAGLAAAAIAYAARSRPSADAVWKTAQADLQAGRFDSARAGLKRLAGLRAATPLDLMLSAQLAIAENKPDQAIASLEQVPRAHYMAAQAHLLEGQIEQRRKRLRLAEEAFREALAINPNLVQAHRELIFIYSLHLRRSELNEEFRALERLTGLSFDNVLHWCTLRNNSWEPSLVVEKLLDYAAADPLDRWSRLALAENFRRMGFYGEAESYLATLAPDDHEALVIRIQIMLDRHELDQAERALATGKPDDPDLARIRGRVLLARGDMKGAEPCFRAAVTADPDNRDTILGLAVALDALGRGREAAHFRERGSHLDRLSTLILRAGAQGARRDPALLRAFSENCAALGRDDEARAWLKLAIALDPLDSTSQRALYKIENPTRVRQ